MTQGNDISLDTSPDLSFPLALPQTLWLLAWSLLLLCTSTREEAGEIEIKIKTVSATIWEDKCGMRVWVTCRWRLVVFTCLKEEMLNLGMSLFGCRPLQWRPWPFVRNIIYKLLWTFPSYSFSWYYPQRDSLFLHNKFFSRVLLRRPCIVEHTPIPEGRMFCNL